METRKYIEDLERNFNIEGIVRDYLNRHQGWREYNRSFTWAKYDTGKPTEEDLARLYFEKPRRFIREINRREMEHTTRYPIPRENIAFLPLRRHNARACLAPNGEPIIIIDVYLERTLGELAAVLTSLRKYVPDWESQKPIELEGLAEALRHMTNLGHYEHSLQRLVGIRKEFDESVFDLFGVPDTGIDWQLTHEYQDGMLFFILLHECSHHINRSVSESSDAFLIRDADSESGQQELSVESVEEDASTPPPDGSGQEKEFEADEGAWELWKDAFHSEEVEEDDFSFNLEFLHTRAGSPLVLFSLLQYGYEKYRTALATPNPKATHPTPLERYRRLRDYAFLPSHPVLQDPLFAPSSDEEYKKYYEMDLERNPLTYDDQFVDLVKACKLAHSNDSVPTDDSNL